MAIELRKIPGISALLSHIPSEQFGRYLLVGLGNTLLGYSAFAAFTWLLQPALPNVYYRVMVAQATASFLTITIAFLAYKWLVFKTRGNYLREWLKCFAVYGSNNLLNLALLPILVVFIRRVSYFERQAPFIAGALLIGFGVVYNFLGHKNFSFKPYAASAARRNAAAHGINSLQNEAPPTEAPTRESLVS
jgi:putative flippase GtrA